MANVKVLKLGLKVSSDTTLVSVPWCGSQPTLRVWLTFDSSTDVWNVLCFEEWMSKGVTMVGLCLVLDWSSQTRVDFSEFVFCLVNQDGLRDWKHFVCSDVVAKKLTKQIQQGLLSQGSCLQLCDVAFIPLSFSFYFYEMEVLILTYLMYESIGFSVFCVW